METCQVVISVFPDHAHPMGCQFLGKDSILLVSLPLTKWHVRWFRSCKWCFYPPKRSIHLLAPDDLQEKPLQPPICIALFDHLEIASFFPGFGRMMVVPIHYTPATARRYRESPHYYCLHDPITTGAFHLDAPSTSRSIRRFNWLGFRQFRKKGMPGKTINDKKGLTDLL